MRSGYVDEQPLSGGRCCGKRVERWCSISEACDLRRPLSVIFLILALAS
jgi:hypothetical protein